MTSNLSFMGTPNTLTKKRYSIAAFPSSNTSLNESDIEAIEITLNILDKDDEGNTSLMRAIKENRPLAVQNIMKKAYTTNSITKLLNLQNKKGETAIKLASEMSNLAIKEYLEGIKIRKINPLLENIKISTSQKNDETIVKNLNSLPEIIKPNIFGTTERNTFIPTIAENVQQKFLEDSLISLTPRIRSISMGGDYSNPTNSLQLSGKIPQKELPFPSQDLKDVISINELGNNRKYSSAETGIFSKKNSTASSWSSNASESPLFDCAFDMRKPSLPKYRHVDGAVDITTNFFPVVKPNDISKQNPETSVMLMLSDKMKNFVNKKDSFQAYSNYDTQLLYMTKEQEEYNNNNIPKKLNNNNDLLELNEYQFQKYSSRHSFNNKLSKNQRNQDEFLDNNIVKNRSQSLNKICDKLPTKY